MSNVSKGLFPEIQPFRDGWFAFSKHHQLYYEESGNPDGKPILFVHGGPGSHTNPDQRRFFDPNFYRIILFDQRGSGKSYPHVSNLLKGRAELNPDASEALEEINTHRFVDDMEALRESLGVGKWVLFGGSWGSTLSMAYSIKHPDRTLGRILRGIFLCRDKDIQWFYQEGASSIYPEAFEIYRDHIPPNERHDLLGAYNRRLNSPDPDIRLEAAKHWSQWEGRTSKLVDDPGLVAKFEDPERAIAFAWVENHFFSNNVFLEDNYLLRGMAKTRNIPTRIIHGRADVVCPIDQAWALKKALRLHDSDYIVTPEGHSASEPLKEAALVQATEDFKAFY